MQFQVELKRVKPQHSSSLYHNVIIIINICRLHSSIMYEIMGYFPDYCIVIGFRGSLILRFIIQSDSITALSFERVWIQTESNWTFKKPSSQHYECLQQFCKDPCSWTSWTVKCNAQKRVHHVYVLNVNWIKPESQNYSAVTDNGWTEKGKKKSLAE